MLHRNKTIIDTQSRASSDTEGQTQGTHHPYKHPYVPHHRQQSSTRETLVPQYRLDLQLKPHASRLTETGLKTGLRVPQLLRPTTIFLRAATQDSRSSAVTCNID